MKFISIAWAGLSLLLATAAQAQADPPIKLMSGQSQVLSLDQAVERVSVAQPSVVDVTLTGTRELYLLGRSVGLSNVMLWRKGSPVKVLQVSVEMDVSALTQQLAQLMPHERGIQVQAAGESVLLSGTVSNVIRAQQAVALAEAHVRALQRQMQTAGSMGHASGGSQAPAGAMPHPMGSGASGAAGMPSGGMSMMGMMGMMGGPSAAAATSHSGVINLLQIQQPQQVMLEVKVAEISRNLLDQFGVSLNLSRAAGSVSYGLLTSSLQDVFGRLTASGKNGSVSVDAKAQDGLIKVLAEPNIVALSGQEGSFLAGGKIFIPVARDNTEGRPVITLEEKEFGVGLKFTPHVLEGDVVQLRVAPEVSEITKAGSPFVTTGGATAVLPSFTSRRASTTVLLRDGQSLAIAGLIKNNTTETISKFPFLGEIPVLGALFRSSEFQTDRSELLFVITPRLLKALPAPVALPTDIHQSPSRVQGLLGGRLEEGSDAERNTEPDIKTDIKTEMKSDVEPDIKPITPEGDPS